MSKHLNNLAINTILMFVFVALFVIPVFSFFTFNVAGNQNQNVLGQTSLNINGMNIIEDEKTIVISGTVYSGQQVLVPLNINVENKQIYLGQNSKDIKVVKNENVVEIYNLSSLDQKVEVLLH